MNPQSEVSLSDVMAEIGAFRSEQKKALERIEKLAQEEANRSNYVTGKYLAGARSMRALAFFTLMFATASIGLALYFWDEAVCPWRLTCVTNPQMIIAGYIAGFGYLIALVGAWMIYLKNSQDVLVNVTNSRAE